MTRTIPTKIVAIILVIFIAIVVFFFAVLWLIWPSAAFATTVSRSSGVLLGVIGMVAVGVIIRTRKTKTQSGGITYRGSVKFLSVYIILVLIVMIIAYTSLDIMSYLTGLAYGILLGIMGLALIPVMERLCIVQYVRQDEDGNDVTVRMVPGRLTLSLSVCVVAICLILILIFASGY